ncbi:HXXEE domain-containing protein [Geodermatophilus chilensis]|uniref:HXXEE domain-containing protein n=1 Tax=Geodermatophilus chilensis TaxID=2035835 RepID=UPI0018E4BC94|nr:HXXEE domain-containing protein [Geodermatophilus chilensis]
MGAWIAAASARGARTDGADPLFQATLAGFGWQAVPHVASAVVTRGYTPGALTAPTVVAPFALWARSRLRRAGVPVTPAPPAAALLGPLLVVGAHVAASGLLGLADRWRRGRTAGIHLVPAAIVVPAVARHLPTGRRGSPRPSRAPAAR